MMARPEIANKHRYRTDLELVPAQQQQSGTIDVKRNDNNGNNKKAYTNLQQQSSFTSTKLNLNCSKNYLICFGSIVLTSISPIYLILLAIIVCCPLFGKYHFPIKFSVALFLLQSSTFPPPSFIQLDIFLLKKSIHFFLLFIDNFRFSYTNISLLFSSQKYSLILNVRPNDNDHLNRQQEQ